ncbi:MAG: TetR/AcrR family transcriptional regulator [Lachnospiraceae bacterium]|nr:TetR/AcrR family transcriptional regulator [Lachnospiraceae bacterium]
MKERRDVTRTKNAIERAYIELLIRNGYKRVTVNEVIELAGVSRGTFYAHYRDIPDLEEKVEERVIRSLREACVVSFPVDIRRSTRTQLEDIFNMFYEYKDDFKKLVILENNDKVIHKMKQILVDAIIRTEVKDMLVGKIGEHKTAMLFESAAGAFVECFVYWMRHDETMTRETALSAMTDFIAGGIGQMLSQK